MQQLGYVGIQAVDLSKWKPFLPALGLELRRDSPADELRFRLDEQPFRISVRQAEEDGLEFIGLESRDGSALSAMGARLDAAGYDVAWAPSAQAELRDVAEMAWLRDPSGFRVELYHSRSVDRRPFEPQGVSGFLAGDLGFGHVVLWTPAYESSIDFYLQLGFRVSDYIDHGDDLDATFLHCNARHHSLAILRQPDPSKRPFMHHFQLEVLSMDDVGRVFERCLDQQIPVSQTIGRHTNDLMISFYVKTPSGFELEYGTDGRLIDEETWRVEQYDTPSIWGHRKTSESLLPQGQGTKSVEGKHGNQ